MARSLGLQNVALGSKADIPRQQAMSALTSIGDIRADEIDVR
jgi:hypothetical protein